MSRVAPRLLALAAGTVLAAAVANAQGAAQPAGSCPAPLEASGSFTADTLFLGIDPGYGIPPVDSMAALTALSVVSDALVLPSPLALPPVIVSTYSTGTGDAPQMVSGGAQGFMGEAFIELERSGKVKQVGLSQTTLVNSIDAGLVDAVQKAANQGAFTAYQDAAKGKGGFIFVVLRTMPFPTFKEKAEDYKRPESLSLVPAPYLTQTMKKKGELVTLPVRALRVPVVRLTSALTITKRGPDPSFPFDDPRDSKNGFVNVEFVVGPDGNIVAGTLRVADAMTTKYANAAIDALKDYQFKPAMAGACPVAARMAYTFTFK
jgi:hypothetical protein